jgi:hypothetical protein
MRQFFAKETLGENAADGDHVGGEEGEGSEGDDDVEGECGAWLMRGIRLRMLPKTDRRSCRERCVYGSSVDMLVGISREDSKEGSTFKVHLEQGKPLSGEKAQSSRDVARAVMLPEKTSVSRMIMRTTVTAFDPVF